MKKLLNKMTRKATLAIVAGVLLFPSLAVAQTGGPEKLPPSAFLKVKEYVQAYPLSCEAAACTVALWYLGVKTDEDAVLARMPYDLTPRSVDAHGTVTWGDPNKGFVGSPKGRYLVTGYGIYAKPMAMSLAGIVPLVEAKEGFSFDDLRAAIAAGNPVVVWVPTRFEKVAVQTWNTNGGAKIKWIEHEHAMVFCGYNLARDEVTLMDVHAGKYQRHSSEEFLRGWSYLGNQAIVFSNTPRLRG